MWAKGRALLCLTLLGCEPAPPATKPGVSIGEMQVIVGKERFGLPFKNAICEARIGAEILTLTSPVGVPVDGRMHFPDLMRVEAGPGDRLNAIAYLPNTVLGGVEYPMAYLVAYPLDDLAPQCEVTRDARTRKVKCNAAHIMPWRSSVPRPAAAFMAEFECPF